ncbi:5'-nucleotidase C-terminal domain-containing protein [Micromonospora sp. BRA006-A]|nr:5'-nucleotidase C-terminal domain-containing protein [Micromonospora sp. BRA006-A]
MDIAKPVGQRITRLVLAGTGTPVAADARFVVAVNNYRRSGGGNFPGHREDPGLQRPAGDPPAAHRLGAGQGRHRPGRLLRTQLEAGARRRAGLLTVSGGVRPPAPVSRPRAGATPTPRRPGPAGPAGSRLHGPRQVIRRTRAGSSPKRTCRRNAYSRR